MCASCMSNYVCVCMNVQVFVCLMEKVHNLFTLPDSLSTVFIYCIYPFFHTSATEIMCLRRGDILHRKASGCFHIQLAENECLETVKWFGSQYTFVMNGSHVTNPENCQERSATGHIYVTLARA